MGLGDRIAIVTIPDAEVRARAETASPMRHERGSLKDETILGTSDMSDARTAYEAAIAAERAEEKNFARVFTARGSSPSSGWKRNARLSTPRAKRSAPRKKHSSSGIREQPLPQRHPQRAIRERARLQKTTP